ncbi:MAG: hypothetical protein WBB25_00375 [Sulfitobacter sp.]
MKAVKGKLVTHLARTIFIALIAIFSIATTATAERELHVVGLYEGLTKTEGRVHGPIAHVRVVRPGAKVTLVLLSYDAIRWHVDASPDTEIEAVLLSNHGDRVSEVRLDGSVFEAARIRRDLPRPRATSGPNFRKLVDILTKDEGFTRLDSFSGAYSAPRKPFWIISTFPNDPKLGSDPLENTASGLRDLPQSLQLALDQPHGPESQLRFASEGMYLTKTAVTEVFIPASLDVPKISWLMGSVYVASQNAAYAVTLGGEGYLYQIDLAAKKWSVVRSMENFDASGLFYDPARKRLLMLGNDGVIEYDFTRKATQKLPINLKDFPGIRDLPRIPGHPGYPIDLIAVDGNHFLFGTTTRKSPGGRGVLPRRVWHHDLNRNRTRLISYEN